MLRQKSKRFYKELYITFKLPRLRPKEKVYLSSYRPFHEGYSSILTTQCFEHIIVI